MNGFALGCELYLDVARPLAIAFLWLSFLVALVETALALWAKWKAAQSGNKLDVRDAKADVGDWTKFLEALAKLLQTLAGLPAWIALFLAGLALLWISGQYPKACSPEQPPPASRT